MQLGQALAGGLFVGAIYALIASGYVLVYRTARTLNFSQGALLLLGGYVTYALTREPFNQPFAAALVEAAVVVAAVGWILYRVIAVPLYNSGVYAVIMATFGADVAIRAGISSNSDWSLHTVAITHDLAGSVRIGGTYVATASIVSVIVVGAILVALGAAVRWTRWGLFMRAAASDVEAAEAQGISVRRNLAIAWVVAGAFAAIAGVLVSTGAGHALSQENYGWALRAFPAVVLGGVDSLSGALVGGLVIGLAESLTALYQPESFGTGFDLIVPYLIMIVVLIIRPEGLLGRREVVRV
ncbi:branched-chain amino acid ABC transporter permease [Dactylosporangium sp. NPDC000555]|uniref:branched-chain amino acid ABC transporter permease n=1 Tax=Dactylosporangium sp. NPDC000555 TaxID=3154260 RepID=UPI0033281540